jgi:hypothetical protein
MSVSATQFRSDDPDLLQRPAVTAENLDTVYKFCPFFISTKNKSH